MIDCIATYHEDPLSCGVAKFNCILSEQLRVPMLQLFDPALLTHSSPLLSIKCAEFSEHDVSRLHQLVNRFSVAAEIALFLHGFSDTSAELKLINRARVVYCGNREIYQRLQRHATTLVKLWSPSTLRPISTSKSIGDIRVFSFGMAHKLRTAHYSKLRRLLDQTGQSYTLFFSMAPHQGASFEKSLAISSEQLRNIFGDAVHYLGFLSDDAVLEYLQRATFFTAFFDQGVRENNSSVIAAMEHGCTVITNTDEYSPSFMEHGKNILDIDRIQRLPTDRAILKTIADGAKDAALELGWTHLLAQLSPRAC